ncbi:MAG: Ig-like domain-containing protein, partial [Bacillota bacterium]|nr:Ig-like domain-containing protein [Bacillota bacterium]
MLRNIIRSHKRTMAFVGAVLVIFVAVVVFAVVRSEAASSGNSAAFGLSDKELKVVSCSLDGLSGVSQGEELVITYNQLVSLKAAEDIKISPLIKGEWRAVDDRLIFSPANRWEAGTYYTVSIDNTGVIGDMDKKLAYPVGFSFETQDSALRIPAKATFSVDKRQYFFNSDEDIVLEAGYSDLNGNVNAAVSVKVWKFANSGDFVDTFGPLFSLPSWAHVSRSKFTGDTDGLEYIGKRDIPLVNGKLEYSKLPAGQYLFRLVVGGAACDVAVTVDDVSLYTVLSGDDLYLWANRGQEPLVGAKVRV